MVTQHNCKAKYMMSSMSISVSCCSIPLLFLVSLVFFSFVWLLTTSFSLCLTGHDHTGCLYRCSQGQSSNSDSCAFSDHSLSCGLQFHSTPNIAVCSYTPTVLTILTLTFFHLQPHFSLTIDSIYNTLIGRVLLQFILFLELHCLGYPLPWMSFVWRACDRRVGSSSLWLGSLVNL